jgi:hypothetical protein
MLQGKEMMYEKMNTGRKMKFLKSQMNLVVPLCLYYQRVVVFQKSEFPQGWWHFQEHGFLPGLDMPPRGFPPGVGVDPKGNVFPKLVPGKNPPRTRGMNKGKASPL